MNLDRLSTRNNVALHKVNIRQGIRQNAFLEKNSGNQEYVWLRATIRYCSLLSYCSLINIKPTCSLSCNRTSIIPQERLVTFPLTFLAYASRLNLQPNITFFITKVYHLFIITEENLQQHTIFRFFSSIALCAQHTSWQAIPFEN